MMEFLILLWPICGWACIYLSTPSWMWEEDRVFAVCLAIFCGALVGPFGIFWFYDGTNDARKE